METKKTGWYKWVVVASCFLMVMVTLGFTSSTKSLFPDEIANYLSEIYGREIPRTLVTINESCRYVTTAIVNIFFGFLIAKAGPWVLVMSGFVSLIGSMLLYSFADNLFLIYLAGVLLGIGLSWTTTTMVGYVVGVWCKENKGTIMGAILASNGLGGAIAIQVVGGFIDPEKVGSYRVAYRVIAIVLAVTAVIVLALFRNRPKGAAIAPVSKKKAKKRGKDWVGISFSEAIRRPYFWGALVCIFFSGLILQGSHGIFKEHLINVGVDYTAVKALMTGSTLILASAKFLTGFVYDRAGLRVTATVCTAIAVITTFMLAFITNSTFGFVLAVLFSIVGAFAMPLETIMLPIYAADLCGEKSYGKVLGLFVSVNTAGYAVGAPVMRLSFDIMGSYQPALIIVGVMMTAILILLQFVISAAHKEQKRVIAEYEREMALAAESETLPEGEVLCAVDDASESVKG